MNYQVKISPDAQMEMRALSGYVRAAALKLLRDLSENPRLSRAKELRGKPNVYRIWLLKRWRVVYQVKEEPKQILVLRVRRKEQIDYESL
jgi:mRNA-degrading endonuclease RelE of RelBE toxin-antitoxin system